MAKRKTQEEFINDMLQKNPNIEILGQYEGLNYPIECKCKVCGNIWSPKANNIYNQNSGCLNCKRVKRHNLKADTHSTFLSELYKVKKDIEVLGTYINNHTNIKCKCTKCQHVWSPRPDSLLAKQGCPHCHKSKGEIAVEEFLSNNKIQYISQYSIKGNFSTRNFIKVDFYLPERNAIIEYNGEQHYIPVEYFGGQLAFEQRKTRDQELKSYCKANGISLIIVPYNQDIKLLLNKKLL